VRCEFEHYARTALVQLRRVREGNQLEEDHMRNRQMIVGWLMAHTEAIEVRQHDGKTYYVLTDVTAFHDGVARLLAEVQRIKSEGDYAGARALFERYGVHFDEALRDEIVARVDALALPSYTAFVMPRLAARYNADGAIVDVESRTRVTSRPRCSSTRASAAPRGAQRCTSNRIDVLGAPAGSPAAQRRERGRGGAARLRRPARRPHRIEPHARRAAVSRRPARIAQRPASPALRAGATGAVVRTRSGCRRRVAARRACRSGRTWC
jgi:hypothetical protein